MEGLFKTLNWIEISFTPRNEPFVKELEKIDQIKKLMLNFFFSGESICLITADPESWSIPDYIFDIETIKFKKNRSLYHVGFSSSLSPTMIEEIIGCPDLDLGNLWVTNVKEMEKVDLLIFEMETRSYQPPFSSEKVYFCERDGGKLYVMNPNKNLTEIQTILKYIKKHWG